MTGFNSSKDITYNLSTSDLNEIVKMFLALNSCPSLLEKLYWKAIYGPKSRISMLASNIVKNVKDDLKENAMRIFAKMSSVLSFQYVSYHEDGNKNKNDKSKIKLSRKIVEVKGEN